MSTRDDRRAGLVAPPTLQEIAPLSRRAIMLAGAGLGAACASTTPVIAGADASGDAVDAYIRNEMATRRIPGLSLAVLRNGAVVKEAAYGVAHVELSAPASLDTVYVLASMTKIFAAVTMMRLVEAGQASLEDSILKHLPNLPSHWRPVTIRHCLSYTSGLPDAVTDEFNIRPIGTTRAELLEQTADAPIHPPGERWAYNQLGYILIVMIIETLMGKDYEQCVRESVLDRIGASQMAFGDAWAIIPRRADLYTTLDSTPDHLGLLARDGVPVVLPDRIQHYGSKVWPDYFNSVGGLNGSVRDLARFEIALAEGRLLRPESIAQMSTPARLRDGSSGAFGLGFLVLGGEDGLVAPGSSPTRRTVAYGGGAATWRLSIPDQNITVLVLTNLQGISPQTLAAGVAQLYES